MPVYGTAQAAYARDNSSSFKDVRLAPGDKKVAFAAPPDESKLPSEAAPGDLLTGTAGLCRSAANSEGPSRRPAAGLLYQVPPRSNKTAKKASSKKDAPAKKAAPTPEAAARARDLLGAAGAALDDKAAIALADKAAASYVAQLEKGSMEDAAADGAPGSSGSLRREPDDGVYARGALAGGLGRGAGLGRQERHGADRERDRGRPSRGGGGRLDESAGRRRYQGRAGDAGHRRHVLRQRHGGAGRARAARKKANEDHAALLAAKRWTAEAALAKGDAAAFEGAMRSLDEWVDTAKSTAADARLRAHRFGLRGQPGLAVRDLGVWLDADAKKKSGAAAAAEVAALRELRRDLMAGLGWERLAAAETKKDRRRARTAWARRPSI